MGSGKGLTPASAAYPQRSSSLLSPSASSISVTSSASTQPSTDAQDLSSRVSFDQGDENNGVAGGNGSRLPCPICNEEMVRQAQSRQTYEVLSANPNLGYITPAQQVDWPLTR